MFKVAALYKFHSIENPLSVQQMLKSNLDDNLVTGTILIGKEGLNGTISASIKDMKKAYLLSKASKDSMTLILNIPNQRLNLLQD